MYNCGVLVSQKFENGSASYLNTFFCLVRFIGIAKENVVFLNKQF